MKLTKCKRCDANNVYWSQGSYGKWTLYNQDGGKHTCDDGKLKDVKCKYCSANDLHWAEEVNPDTKEKRHVLTESYGLPHACDERIATLAKEKKERSDKYEAEKKRVNEHPEGKCAPCNGTGNDLSKVGLSRGYGLCTNCHGHGRFDVYTRKHMLASVRQQIWPNMKDNYNSYRRRRW